MTKLMLLFAVVIYSFALIGVWETFTQDNPNDVNGDGIVSIKDLSIVAYYLDDVEYEE